MEIFLNIFFLPIDDTQIDTPTSGQSGTEGNGNRGILHTPQITRTGASISDTV